MAFGNYGKKATKEELSYEVIENFGSLTTDQKMNKELRLISWNGNDPKYDIRYWGIDDEGCEKMGKGITLTSEEMENLFNLLEILKASDSE